MQKIHAAKRLAATLFSEEDFSDWLTDHPREAKAMERLLEDILQSDNPTISSPVWTDASRAKVKSHFGEGFYQ